MATWTSSQTTTTIIASETSRASAPTSRSGSDTSYTKKKEFRYDEVAGTVRVKFTLTGPTGTGYGRVYKNSVAVGTERSTTGSLPVSEDIAVSNGDLVQIYGKASSGGSYAISAALLCYDKQIDVVSSTVITD